MTVNIGDKFFLHGVNLLYKIVNINDFRPSDMKYACDIFDEKGNSAFDVLFIGDDFFTANKDKIERV